MQGGFDPAAFALLSTIEDEHFWFVARNKLIAGLADRFFPAAGTVLEVGCGNGIVLRALARSRRWRRMAGADLHPEGLALARQRVPEAIFAERDFENLNDLGTFDLIGAFDVLEHVVEDDAAIRMMRGMLSPGGGLILAVPQHPFLWGPEDERGHHVRRYRRGELERKLERQGLGVMFSSSYVASLFPLMAASRLLSRLRGSVSAAETRIGVLNGAMTAILNAEVGMTLAGVRWPFGGSRVVVAALQ